MISNAQRFSIVLLFFAAISPMVAFAGITQDLNSQRIEARRNYDVETSHAVLQEMIACAKESTDEMDATNLAYAALAFAELQRMEYEEDHAVAKERRAMGKSIDAAAKVGHKALEKMADSSEKYRIRADLYGMMIRTDYQGKKYAKKMDKASVKALELDSNNPDARVTASKKLVFATKRQGGNVAEGLDHLNIAISLDDSHELALILRGTAHEKLGNYEAAKADWKRAAELNPSCKPAIKNLQRMADEGH
jgi:tetratricopeptide (TPR) repeat protein